MYWSRWDLELLLADLMPRATSRFSCSFHNSLRRRSNDSINLDKRVCTYHCLHSASLPRTLLQTTFRQPRIPKYLVRRPICTLVVGGTEEWGKSRLGGRGIGQTGCAHHPKRFQTNYSVHTSQLPSRSHGWKASVCSEL